MTLVREWLAQAEQVRQQPSLPTFGEQQQTLLTAFQKTALTAVTARFENYRAWEALPKALVNLFKCALYEASEGTKRWEVNQMMGMSEKHLAPLLNELVPRSSEQDAPWLMLPKPDGGGVDPWRLLMMGVFDKVSNDQAGQDLLLQLTRTLLEFAPENAIDLLALLGEHLRSTYLRTADRVDLGMVALVLPVVLKELEKSGDIDEKRDLLVAGLSFNLDSPSEYLTHWMQWVTVARAQGVTHPEDLVRECFQRHPEDPPKIALFRTSKDNLLGEASRGQYRDKQRSASGLRGLLAGSQEWADFPLSTGPRSMSSLSANPTYRFLREVRAPVDPSVEDLKTPETILRALKLAIPPYMRDVALDRFFDATEIYLPTRSEGDPISARLSQSWRQALRPNASEGEALPYHAWHKGAWKHPWLQLTDALADALG
jgi:hypothetical protein